MIFCVRIFFCDQVCIFTNPRNHLEHLPCPHDDSEPPTKKNQTNSLIFFTEIQEIQWFSCRPKIWQWLTYKISKCNILLILMIFVTNRHFLLEDWKSWCVVSEELDRKWRKRSPLKRSKIRGGRLPIANYNPTSRIW